MSLSLYWSNWRALAIPFAIAFVWKRWLSREEAPTDILYAALEHQLFSSGTFRRIGYLSDRPSDAPVVEPDTTAVVLNWSRFENVVLIATLLCKPHLNDVIAEVFVWNNNPAPISFHDFNASGCPPNKLRIFNSPDNVYFQARFLACAQANTRFCFIQDDDYLVLPEVIMTLNSRINLSEDPHTIHLLPAHEYLSSALREIHVPNPQGSKGLSIHTSFAWLGHGAMLHRSEAVDFLALMRRLNTTDEQMKMADNYYTILSNRIPEIWFDQGIELGGGQPFTVGSEGEERNNRHILGATEFLNEIVNQVRQNEEGDWGPIFPYLSARTENPMSVARAVCGGASCLLEINIALLPENLVHSSGSIKEILALEKHNHKAVSPQDIRRFIDHPPSHSIDGNSETFFQSYQGAKVGDYISLEVSQSVDDTWRERSSIEMWWIVDEATERILQESTFSSSWDGDNWVQTQCPTLLPLKCRDVHDFIGLNLTVDGSASAPSEDLRECSVELNWGGHTGSACRGGRFVRAVAQKDMSEKWRIHEVWLRRRR